MAAAAPIEDLSIIDVDAHITEPHDLWTARAPASLKDRVPRVVGSGTERAWVVDTDIQISSTNPSSVIAKNGEKSRGTEFFGWQIEDVHEASYDMKQRVGLLDRFGLYAQVLYPNGNSNAKPGYCSLGLKAPHGCHLRYKLHVRSTEKYTELRQNVAESGRGPSGAAS